MEVVGKIIFHSIGIPTTAIMLLNIDLKTWPGLVTFCLSSFYILALIVVFCIKSYQSIRRENFEHKLRKKKAS